MGTGEKFRWTAQNDIPENIIFDSEVIVIEF
jgi:hypothetical protein